MRQTVLLQLPINRSSKQIQSLYDHSGINSNIVSRIMFRIMADSILAAV